MIMQSESLCHGSAGVREPRLKRPDRQGQGDIAAPFRGGKGFVGAGGWRGLKGGDLSCLDEIKKSEADFNNWDLRSKI